MTEHTQHIKNGIYLIGDKTGQISRVMYDDMQLCSGKNVPFSFMELIAEASLSKAADFLSHIQSREILFDQELFVRTDDEPRPLMFTAARLGNKIWIIGATQNEMLEKMLDEMMFINNEQQNLLRYSEKKLSEYNRQEKSVSENAFDEISQVNNELINAQRKLAKQNEEILRLNENLEQTNKELQHFAYALSHDLKEPLRMVRSFMNLLDKKYGTQLDDKAREYIHFAVDGADRMNGLISDLLEYSRVGRKHNRFDKTDLNEVLQKVMQLNEGLIKEAGAVIEADSLPEMEVQRIPIEQLFNNLIGNSLKYRKTDATPQITIKAQEQAGHWLFSVADNGRGIPQELHTSIFDLFKRGQAESTQDLSGSGMGLAIAKKIVQEHHGEIWVSSAPGKGSTFFFTLAKPTK